MLILSRRCFDHLAFPGSSRFAYLHQFTQTWWEKSQIAKRMHKTSRSMKNLPWKPLKCQLIWKLKLALPRPRITLRAERNKLYESIINQNRLSSWLRHGLKYWTVSSVPGNIAYTMRNSSFIHPGESYTVLFLLIWIFLDGCSFSNVQIRILRPILLL